MAVPHTPLFPLLLLCVCVWSYEAPEDKQDVFARRACPAFLTFANAAFLSGATVELPCHCKPKQVQSVVWFYRKHMGTSAETRALTDHHGNKLLDPSNLPHSGDLRSRFSIRLFSLMIFRAGREDSGVYICGSTHTDFFTAYDLDVQEARKISFYAPRLHPQTTNKKSKTSAQTLGSAHPLYQLFTSFRPWAVCDRCGLPGEQVRTGLCYVHSHFLHVRYRRTNQTVASCGSGAVPKAFGKLKGTRVGAKMEVKTCQVECPKEAAKKSAIRSMMEFLGYNSGSMVPVFYLSHPADRPLTLGCPRARPNMAVAWDRGTKQPIYRSQHMTGGNHSDTSPRLLIDTGHHLVFKPAKTQDTGVYYCWLQGRRAAEIRLLVYAHLGRGQSVTSHPDFPVALRKVMRSYVAMTAAFCLLLVVRAYVKHFRDAHGD